MPSSLIATFVVLAIASVIGVIVAWVAFTAEEPVSQPSAEDQYNLAGALQMANNEKTSPEVAKLASKVLSGEIIPTVAQAKTLAASVLTQAPDKDRYRPLTIPSVGKHRK